uniref:Uncharacterized protein n=1 Tax=Parascaris univalens TaxID=6257 RepID=A0A915AB15_PARUN
ILCERIVLMRSTSLGTLACCSAILLCTINAAISKYEVNNDTHDKVARDDVKTKRPDGLENIVKNPPTTPQLAIHHNNTLSKADKANTTSSEKSDKGDAVTTTASASPKKPIYTTTGFVGCVRSHRRWLLAIRSACHYIIGLFLFHQEGIGR